MEEKIARIGVSLPKQLLWEFDDIVKSREYSSRSEAIRDAMRNYIAEYKWLEKGEEEITGVVNVVYDHNFKGISDKIISIQHEFIDVIIANLHLRNKHCLEIILVRGDMRRIKRLVDRIVAIRGVTNVKLVTT